MNKRVKSRWLKALRSGKFRRAKSQLKDRGGYCCLGVLCRIEAVDTTDDQYMPPDSFLRKIRLSKDDAITLSTLNDGCVNDKTEPPKGYRDGEGASFRVIADWISKNIKGE